MSTAEPVAPQEQPVDMGEEAYSPIRGVEQPGKHARRPMGKCIKCGKWKFRTPDKASEFVYYPSRQAWSGWCKQCYAAAINVGQRAAKARKAGDQAGALIPGEGERQRTIRRGDQLMTVEQWLDRQDGALVLLSGEAVYQLDTSGEKPLVRILRRAPLSRLTPVDADTFRWLRGKEEGVFYQ